MDYWVPVRAIPVEPGSLGRDDSLPSRRLKARFWKIDAQSCNALRTGPPARIYHVLRMPHPPPAALLQKAVQSCVVALDVVCLFCPDRRSFDRLPGVGLGHIFGALSIKNENPEPFR